MIYLASTVTNVFTENIVDKNTIEKFLDELPDKALRLGVRVLLAILCFFVGIQIIKLIRKIIKKSMTKAKAETGAIQFVDSFVKVALYVVLIMLLASSFGVDAASIVAILGSAGVAIGLAIQGSLSNLAGGVLILLLKPFRVGDYIQESATGKEGTVTEIQIFYTKLLTVDNKTVILPNGTLANHSLVNVTAQRYRRIDVPVGISYKSNIKLAKDTLLKVLEEDTAVLKDKEMIVFVDDLGESSVKMNVRCWTTQDNYWTCKWRITENCKLALDAAGVEIPFNQLDVHLDK